VKKVIVLIVTILVLTGCSGRNQLSQTTLDPEFFTGKIEGEITISAYDAMVYGRFLEEAARAFNEIYPDVKLI